MYTPPSCCFGQPFVGRGWINIDSTREYLVRGKGKFQRDFSKYFFREIFFTKGGGCRSLQGGHTSFKGVWQAPFNDILRDYEGNYRGEMGVSRLISCRKEQGGNAIVIARDPCKRCCSPTRPSLRAFLHDRKHYLTSLPRIRACRGKFTRVSNRAPTESR